MRLLFLLFLLLQHDPLALVPFYGSIHELVEKELALPADQRIDFVSVATPNHTHFEIAKTAAQAGFNVICDKPMTFDLKQAEELAEVVKKSVAH